MQDKSWGEVNKNMDEIINDVCVYCGMEVENIISHVNDKHKVEWEKYLEDEENCEME